MPTGRAQAKAAREHATVARRICVSVVPLTTTAVTRTTGTFVTHGVAVRPGSISAPDREPTLITEDGDVPVHAAGVVADEGDIRLRGAAEEQRRTGQVELACLTRDRHQGQSQGEQQMTELR